MENINFVLKLKNQLNDNTFDFIVTENFSFGIQVKNPKDNYLFLSSDFNAFELAGFILATIAGQIKKDFKFKDNNAIFLENNQKKKAIINVSQGSGSSDPSKFYLFKLPAVVYFATLDLQKESFYRFNYLLALDYLAKIKKIYVPENQVFMINRLQVIKNINNVSLRVSLPKNIANVDIEINDLKIFIGNLERYLSGQFISDSIRIINFYQNQQEQQEKQENKKINRPYWTTRYNKNSLFFSGTPNPRLEINSNKIFVNYYELAVLYFILKSMLNSLN